VRVTASHVALAVLVVAMVTVGAGQALAQPAPFANTPRFAAVWAEETLGMMVAFSPEGIFTMISTTNPDGDPVAGTWGVVRNRIVLRTAVGRPSQIWSDAVTDRQAAALVNGAYDLAFVIDLGKQREDLAGTLRIWNARFEGDAVASFTAWDEDGALALPVLFRPVFRVYSMVPEVGGELPGELLPLLYKLDPGEEEPIELPDQGGQQGGARPKDSIPYDDMPGSQMGVH